jgi:hypothetical protein
VIDGVGPLCDVVVDETVVAWTTDKGNLGEASLVVVTVVGMEEISEEVICSITRLGTDRHS